MWLNEDGMINVTVPDEPQPWLSEALVARIAAQSPLLDEDERERIWEFNDDLVQKLASRPWSPAEQDFVGVELPDDVRLDDAPGPLVDVLLGQLASIDLRWRYDLTVLLDTYTALP